MTSEEIQEFTRILRSSTEQSLPAGESMGDVFPFVYKQLKAVAHRQLEMYPAQSLDTTGLVHEAYLKMVDQDRATANDRGHFFRISAMAMRQVLVSAARHRMRQKRGAGVRPLTLTDFDGGLAPELEDIVLVHDSLEKLRQIDPRLEKVVECRFFAGLTEDETAVALEVSVRTVQRDWRRARAWLRRYLSGN